MFINRIVDLAKRRSLWALFLLALLSIISCRFISPHQSALKLAPQTGKMIVFAGISGSGKSTLARELGALIKAKIFLEPEEKNWPSAVRKSHLYGEFSAFSTLRNLRIQNLYDADLKRKEGFIAIVDSYYDKITHHYLGKPGMEWLISPQDPYYEVAQTLTKIDEEKLPNADCIILLDVDMDTWREFLTMRDRDRDHIDGFQENFLAYHRYIEEATLNISQKLGIKIIHFRPSKEKISLQAMRLRQLLIDENIL